MAAAAASGKGKHKGCTQQLGENRGGNLLDLWRGPLLAADEAAGFGWLGSAEVRGRARPGLPLPSRPVLLPPAL